MPYLFYRMIYLKNQLSAINNKAVIFILIIECKSLLFVSLKTVYLDGFDFKIFIYICIFIEHLFYIGVVHWSTEQLTTSCTWFHQK